MGILGRRNKGTERRRRGRERETGEERKKNRNKLEQNWKIVQFSLFKFDIANKNRFY